MTHNRLRNYQKTGVRTSLIYVYATSVAITVAVVIAAFIYFNLGNVFETKASGITYYARASGHWSDPNT